MGFYTHTYEQIKKINNKIKDSCINTMTIVKISFSDNLVKLRIKNKRNNATYERYMSIDALVNSIFLHKESYITNISVLKIWKGFSSNQCVYLSFGLINELDLYIFNPYFDYETNECIYNLRFCTISTDEIESFLLRNKVAYNAKCKQLDEHFWSIIREMDKVVILVSDRPIYTPINSEKLFYKAHFNNIDLSNVTLSHTKNFDRAFANSYCSFINFGDNPITKSVKSLNSMYMTTSHLKTIDMKDWNLSNVSDISYFCCSSHVKNLYLNSDITKSIKDMTAALFETNLQKTNIYSIFTTEQIEFMKQAKHEKI